MFIVAVGNPWPPRLNDSLDSFLVEKKIGKSLPRRRFKKSFYQGSSKTLDHLKAKSLKSLKSVSSEQRK